MLSDIQSSTELRLRMLKKYQWYLHSEKRTRAGESLVRTFYLKRTQNRKKLALKEKTREHNKNAAMPHWLQWLSALISHVSSFLFQTSHFHNQWSTHTWAARRQQWDLRGKSQCSDVCWCTHTVSSRVEAACLYTHTHIHKLQRHYIHFTSFKLKMELYRK